MNNERLRILAENGAKRMVDTSLPINERIQSIETDEIRELSESEYSAFRQMMVEYMRELVRGEK